MNNYQSSAKGLELAGLANRIRTARRKASLSQTELARRIGVSASAVAQWEHPSGTHPSLQSLVRILEITGISVDWLLLGRGSNRTNLASSEENLPAVSLDCFAHSMLEEDLLKVFREMPTKRQVLLMDLAAALSLAHTSRVR